MTFLLTAKQNEVVCLTALEKCMFHKINMINSILIWIPEKRQNECVHWMCVTMILELNLASGDKSFTCHSSLVPHRQFADFIVALINHNQFAGLIGCGRVWIRDLTLFGLHIFGLFARVMDNSLLVYCTVGTRSLDNALQAIVRILSKQSVMGSNDSHNVCK